MLPQEKTQLLKAFLGDLRAPAAGQLADAVERDRLMEGHGLPHEDILSGLRPMLRQEHYGRSPTALRLFCRPFQDLLTSQPRKCKQKGAIARSCLIPIWSWVCQTLIPAQAQNYSEETKALVLAQQNQQAVQNAAQFWPLAAKAIADALCTPARRKQAQKILEVAFAVEDAEEIALLLSAGETVELLGALLPAPVASFDEPLVWQVRAIYERLVNSQPDVAPYVAVITMNRLAKPWEALRLPLLVTRHADETMICQTDMGLVGEILFSRMDGLRNAIQLTRHPIFDAEKLMEEAKSFADLSRHIVTEIELKRQGEWGKRLLAERAQIGKVMETFMERAARELALALPMQKATGADFSKMPAPEKRELALRYARLVAGSRNFAAAVSFAAKQKSVYDELCALLERYNCDVVKALKNTPQNAIVTAQFSFCAQLTAVLFSEEEAELLRRRGKAAKAAAA